MVTHTATGRSEVHPADSRDKNKDHSVERIDDRDFVRNVETEPNSDSAKILAVGAVVPLGMSAAALATTLLGKQERVSIAAWVAAAVVGSVSMIASAAVSHRRIVSVERTNQGTRATDQIRAAMRTKAE